jgi:hypothetical protein
MVLYILDDLVHRRLWYIVGPSVNGHTHLPAKNPEAEAFDTPAFVERAASMNPLPVESKRTFGAFPYHILDLHRWERGVGVRL